MFWVVLFCFVLPAQPLLDELDRCYQYGKVVWEQSWPGNRGMRMWRAQMDSDLQRSRCRGADFIPSPLLCHHCPTRCRDEHTLWEETFPFSPRWKKKKKHHCVMNCCPNPGIFDSLLKKKKKKLPCFRLNIWQVTSFREDVLVTYKTTTFWKILYTH